MRVFCVPDRRARLRIAAWHIKLAMNGRGSAARQAGICRGLVGCVRVAIGGRHSGSSSMIRTISSTARGPWPRSCPLKRRRLPRCCQAARPCRSGAPDLRRPHRCKGRAYRADPTGPNRPVRQVRRRLLTPWATSFAVGVPADTALPCTRRAALKLLTVPPSFSTSSSRRWPLSARRSWPAGVARAFRVVHPRRCLLSARRSRLP